MPGGSDLGGALSTARGAVGATTGLLERMTGGHESIAFRDPSNDLVVLVYPAYRLREELEWALNIAGQAHSQVPEAVAALPSGSGRVVTADGRLAAIFPYVEGTPLEAGNENLIRDAARVLAAVHRCLIDWSPAPRPGPGPDTPLHKRIDPEGLGMLAAQEIPGLEDDELDDWAQAVPSQGWSSSLTQGDFNSTNLLCHDERVVGIIDWHDARIEPCLSEAAWAAWNLSQGDLGASEGFLRAYQAYGGPVEDQQLSEWVRFARTRIRDSARRAVAIGCAADDPYLRLRVRSFQELKELQSLPFGSRRGHL